MRSTDLADSFRKELSASKDIQQFLQIYLQERGAQARLCRKAGFTSRSYLNELMNGKKGLSRDSLTRIKSSLGLGKSWAQFFEYLAWDTSPSLRPAQISEQTVKLSLKEKRKELETVVPKQKKSITESFVHSPQVFQVYAGLGTLKDGATLDQIIQRTKLPSREVEKSLRRLLNVDAISTHGDRFFAKESQADALGLNDKDSLAEMLRQVCGHVQKNRHDILKEKNNLSVYTAFSVQSQHLPALKEKLQQAIYGVLDEFQNDGGDQVQQVFINLFGQPLQSEEVL